LTAGAVSQASKFLSLVLRHEPEQIGIELDTAGWTDIETLLVAMNAHGVTLTRAGLDELVASSDKQRFAISEDGRRIRANQGHSVAVELQLPAADPPAVLYHGTIEANLESIRARGLLKGERRHVHMSADIDTAKKVGGRRGRPVVLAIQAGEMAAAETTFFVSENGVWLVDHVPPDRIEVLA
jgi:putative RNA 2'-phosphotransferase